MIFDYYLVGIRTNEKSTFSQNELVEYPKHLIEDIEKFVKTFHPENPDLGADSVRRKVFPLRRQGQFPTTAFKAIIS